MESKNARIFSAKKTLQIQLKQIQKDMQLLSIEPQDELEFKRPFQNIVKQTITVLNTSSDSSLAFKVKTTVTITFLDMNIYLRVFY